MGIRIQNGKWHYRFQIQGRRYFGATDLPAIERNKNSAREIELEAHKAVKGGRAETLKLQIQPFNEAAAKFKMWAKGEYRSHPESARRIAVSLSSLTVHFRRRSIHTVTPGDIEDYKSWRRSNGIKEVTLRNDLLNLSLFFQYAMKHHWCPDNPVRAVTIPSSEDAIRMYILKPEEELLYFETAGRYPSLHDLGRLILLQGMRPEEVMELRQDAVDLEAGTLEIRDGKSRAAKRVLKLTAESRAILATRRTKGTWVFPGKSKVDHIKKVNGSHAKILQLLAESGIDPPLRFVLYDLRHTFATRFYRATKDLVALAAILGHANLKTAQKYVHLDRQDQFRAMEIFEASLLQQPREQAEVVQ